MQKSARRGKSSPHFGQFAASLITLRPHCRQSLDPAVIIDRQDRHASARPCPSRSCDTCRSRARWSPSPASGPCPSTSLLPKIRPRRPNMRSNTSSKLIGCFSRFSGSFRCADQPLNRSSRSALMVTITVAPVSARIAGQSPVMPATLVTRKTAFSPSEMVTF